MASAESAALAEARAAAVEVRAAADAVFAAAASAHAAAAAAGARATLAEARARAVGVAEAGFRSAEAEAHAGSAPAAPRASERRATRSAAASALCCANEAAAAACADAAAAHSAAAEAAARADAADAHAREVSLCLAPHLRRAAAANVANRALDALFVGAQHGGSAWAADLFAVGSTCCAARDEEALWSALARVHCPRWRRTTLMHAACFGLAPRATWLLARGAPIDALNAYGCTALWHASEGWEAGSGHAAIVHALIAAGASVDSASTNFGVTPLMAACSMGRAESASVLLSSGASVRAAAHGGRIAIHFAAARGDVASLDACVCAGADANAASGNGQRPLHLAALADHVGAAAALLRAGASRTVRDHRGQSARDVAAEGVSSPMKALLDGSA
jgi:hypothetical protein